MPKAQECWSEGARWQQEEMDLETRVGKTVPLSSRPLNCSTIIPPSLSLLNTALIIIIAWYDPPSLPTSELQQHPPSLSFLNTALIIIISWYDPPH